MNILASLLVQSKNLKKGEVAAMITVIAAVFMVAGSVIGLSTKLNNSQTTKSLAACVFNPTAFVKIDIGAQVLPLTTTLDPKIFDNGVWQTQNDRSVTSFLGLDGATGLIAKKPVVDSMYCCGDAGFNNEAGWRAKRSYKVGQGELASVRLIIKDPRYKVVKQCPYDQNNPDNPKCQPVSSNPSRLWSNEIDQLPVDCLKYSYGWIVKCEGEGCPQTAITPMPTIATQPSPTIVSGPTPTPHLFKACKAHFIIDNSGSVRLFSDETRAAIVREIQKYRQIPGHQNDSVKINYQFFNKQVYPESPYVAPEEFKFPEPFIKGDWTNIDAALNEAIAPSDADTKIVNLFISDGKPTIRDAEVSGRQEKCVAGYEAREIQGCRPCLSAEGPSTCPAPHMMVMDKCPSDVQTVCKKLNYQRDYIDPIIAKTWVDYAISMGTTPNIELLNAISRNGIIEDNKLAEEIADIFEKECGIPAPTPGKERSRDLFPTLRVGEPTLSIKIDKNKADINRDRSITALDVASCLTQNYSLICDIVVDGKVNAQDRSAHISLLGTKL